MNKIEEIEKKYQLNVAKKDRGHLVGFQTDAIEDDMEILLNEVKRLQSEKDELLGKYLDSGETIQHLRMDKFELEQEVKRLQGELQLAIEHDRQPYPTAWAYEQVCKSLQEEEASLKRLREGIEKHRRDMWGEGEKYQIGHDIDEELYKLLEEK